jgi:alkylation response protein AidB-like acyl-CoA dehydrogenase
MSIAASTRLRGDVRALIPLLRAATESSDRDRRVPAAVIAALRAAGVHRMFVPQALGGDQVDLQTFVDVVETVAEGNAAAGWDVATSSLCAFAADALPREGAARIFGNGPDVVGAGSLARGGGRAEPADGGYRVTGRWGFASGCMDADWMIGGPCTVFDGDAPRLDSDGQPEIRYVFFPRSEVTVEDTWQVVGMRGTGSHDWGVSDAFVPDELTQLFTAPSPWPGALYRLPRSVIASVHFSAVETGIARHAIDSFVELAQEKVPTMERRTMSSRRLLRERVQAQEAVARAEFLLESARAYRARIIAEIWATAEAGEAPSLEQRARLRLAGTAATENAVRAVDMMFHAAGTTAIEEASPLSHCFRDVHVAAQSIVVSPLFFEHVGRVLLGLEPGTTMF